ncbi:MAG: SH3 domain-containing protein, partial [Oscillospiraceae bacterium]|nr:SH3 domain-containing protein [Oscillospiraceae bacterium]
NYTVLSSLYNGTSVTVLEAAEGGWYKISFPGQGGAATEGYILGDYISTN